MMRLIMVVAALIATGCRVLFELLKLGSNVGDKILAELLGALHLFRIRTGDVQKHGVFRLSTACVLHESGATSFDLHPTARLLLDVLHISPTMTNDLSSEIEAW